MTTTSSPSMKMISSRHLLQAIYEWLIDKELTPYIMVDAMMPNVEVPKRFTEDGKIILNIKPQAVGRLRIDNDAVEFDARFSRIAHHLFIPIPAIKTIYAFENGRGVIFNEKEDGTGGDGDENPLPLPPSQKAPVHQGRPKLKIVK